ncbi:MAG: hypothetical protein MJZ38_00215 [archaeon]|nr:hypothetical protein [archaeon]
MGESADARMMTEEPRRAILVIAASLIVAILISHAQTFIDMAWCAGLGSAALSAVNLSGPLCWIVLDVGIGLGVGASTAVARRLGAGERDRADSMAVQSLLLAVTAAVLTMVVLLPSCDILLRYLADGGDIGLCREYVLPQILFSVPIVMHGMVIGLLRAEGAGRRVLRLSVVSAALNLVLVLILIYVLGLGLTGASLATCISFLVPVLVALCWYAGGRMHVRMSLRGARVRPDEIKEVAYVGVPHMLELLAIGILMIPQNMLVMRTGGDIGMVLTMTPFKFILLAAIPAQGLAEAMIPVTSATQGAGNMAGTLDGFRYTVLMASVVSLALSAALFILADPVSWVYTYSDDMVPYHDEFVRVLRMFSIIVFLTAMTTVASSIMQSLRRPVLATTAMFVRESVFIGMYVVASGIGMEAIYHSMVAGMLFGMVLMCTLAWLCIRNTDFGTKGPQRIR